MRFRRFVYDSQSDAVVELGGGRTDGHMPDLAEAESRHAVEQNEVAGRQLRDTALDIAERREWAHKRHGDERRWRE